MNLPFTREQFFAVFRDYNEAVWPLQLPIVVLAFAALVLAVVGGRSAARAACAILAALWAWAGVVYHLGFFLTVNPAAALFGAMFLCAAALFAWEGVVHARLQFDAAVDWRTVAAFVLAGYALVVYPLLGPMLGRDMAEAASFGLPCPVTIFTLGMLGLARRPFPRSVFVVPVLWALIGVQAAWLFGAYEDLGLAVAALAALWFALPARWEGTAA